MRPLLVPTQILMLMLMLHGCAGYHSSRDAMSVYDGVSVDFPGDGQALAALAAEGIAKRYSPGQTTLVLAKTESTFGQDLDSALRERGFSVAPPDSSGIQIAYTLDVIRDQSPPTCYLRVRTSDQGVVFETLRSLTAAPRRPVGTSPAEDIPSGVTPPSSYQLKDAAAEISPVPQPVMPAKLERKAGSDKRFGMPVRVKSTAAKIAKRNKVPLADFCRWNAVTPETVVGVGHIVYLRDPGPEAIPTATPAPVSTSTVAAAAAKAPAPVVEPATVIPATTPAPVSTPTVAATATIAPVPVVEPATVTPAAATPAPISTPTVVPTVAKAPAPIVEPATVIPTTTPASVSSPAGDPNWEIIPGSLHGQVQSWAERAQYRVIWRASHDLEMDSHASFNGSFVDAVKQLFFSLNRSGHPLRVTVYQGNNVLEVAED